MFDIAFTELMVAAVVALIVIGPERLPRVARQCGEWLGKLQRYVNDVKADVNRQIQLDELRNLKDEVTSAAKDLESSFNSAVSDTQQELDQLGRTLAGDEPEPLGTPPATDWERVYEARRTRERIRDRRVERDRELGRKRPRRRFH
ncbi:MAG: Sec-independent protein translocase protein TatB [Burkholderiaceae bacterium]|jgi:sec-independent protein translocase protein TatB|nr:Sec-independent protein translocase protein TatB [Burkholderiaceae bacterium]MEB2318990.1 Sec-independent protein translocase protein TatB [Pseudomonadota bacterium]